MPLPIDKAAPPSHLTSQMTLTVRFCETDLMGIVHHANYLIYFEMGRVDWLLRRGVSYESWVQGGLHLPVVETRLRYRKAARFGEILVVETTCRELTRVTVNFGFLIKRPADQVLICEGETLLACVGNDLAPKRFPADMAAVFRSPETSPPHPSAPGD
jgi:acyl-CoA thioester hydrolase